VSASRLSGDSTPFVGFRWQSFTQSVSGGTTDWAPSFAVAAIQPPFAPRLALRSSPDGTSVRVNWWANKANLTYTEVRYRQVGAAWSPVRRVGHQIRSLDLDDVVPGKRYEVSIVLVSPGGRSRAVTKSLLHLAPPSAPRNLNVTAYRGFLAVTFDRPASSGGHRDLNWYAVAWSDAGNVYDLEQTPDGRTLYFVDTPTLPITLGVRAFTDRGHGEWAAVRITEMPPGVERGAG
jgi:hypothetical protein